MFAVGGFHIPQLGNVSTPVGDGLVEKVLEETSNELNSSSPSKMKSNDTSSALLQGAQLRELEAYLETTDSRNTLRNLYCTVTDDGH